MYLLEQWWVWLTIYILGLSIGFYLLGYFDENDDLFWPPVIFWPIFLPIGAVVLVIYWIARLPLELGKQHREGRKE